jgi:Flp pilus assembly pilin Flp
VVAERRSADVFTQVVVSHRTIARACLGWLTAAVAPLRRDDRGATAVEYGLIVALIAAVIIVIVGLVGGKVADAFSTMYNTW